jgi:hypothetical protein
MLLGTIQLSARLSARLLPPPPPTQRQQSTRSARRSRESDRARTGIVALRDYRRASRRLNFKAPPVPRAAKLQRGRGKGGAEFVPWRKAEVENDGRFSTLVGVWTRADRFRVRDVGSGSAISRISEKRKRKRPREDPRSESRRAKSGESPWFAAFSQTWPPFFIGEANKNDA